MKKDKDNVRKLTKVSGHSFAVTLPIEMVRELGWFTPSNNFKSS